MHFLQKKKLTKIGQIWLRQLLKENTAAYRGSPPCTQSQYIPTERRVQQFSDQYWATDFPRHDFPLNILAIIITTIKTITTTNIIIIIIIIISVIITSILFYLSSWPLGASFTFLPRSLPTPSNLSASAFHSLTISAKHRGANNMDNILYGLLAAALRGQILCCGSWSQRGEVGSLLWSVCNSFFAKKNLQILPH